MWSPQDGPTRREKKQRARADRSRRLRHTVKTAMPVALDMLGLMLLSTAAMLIVWAAAGPLYAGGAAALTLGLGCHALNRVYLGEGRRQRR